MGRREVIAGLALSAVLCAPAASAQDVGADPLSPNEAFVATPKPGSAGLAFSAAASVSSATKPSPASAVSTMGPDAPRILHADELFFHGAPGADRDLKLNPDWMAAHFIDVGQGSAVLLEFSCGAALIDAGGQSDEHVDSNARLMAYLKGFFARRSDLNKTLDVVFFTHPHPDHNNGGAVARSNGPTTPATPGLVPPTGPAPYKIGRLVTNAEDTGSGIENQRKLLAFAKAQAIPLLQIRNADIRRSDGLTNKTINPFTCPSTSPDIRVLWGSERGGHAWEDKGNNHSLVIRVDFAESSFLFIGDLEQAAQPELVSSYARYPAILDVDVYHAGHHGSHNGTTLGLVKAITPEIAVISAGDPSEMQDGFSAYEFGHPNLKAIKILTDPATGVSRTRSAEVFPVGIKGRHPTTRTEPEFDHVTIDRAIYATGWDGDIVITASASGEKKVHVR